MRGASRGRRFAERIAKHFSAAADKREAVVLPASTAGDHATFDETDFRYARAVLSSAVNSLIRGYYASGSVPMSRALRRATTAAIPIDIAIGPALRNIGRESLPARLAGASAQAFVYSALIPSGSELSTSFASATVAEYGYRFGRLGAVAVIPPVAAAVAGRLISRRRVETGCAGPVLLSFTAGIAMRRFAIRRREEAEEQARAALQILDRRAASDATWDVFTARYADPRGGSQEVSDAFHGPRELLVELVDDIPEPLRHFYSGEADKATRRPSGAETLGHAVLEWTSDFNSRTALLDAQVDEVECDDACGACWLTANQTAQLREALDNHAARQRPTRNGLTLRLRLKSSAGIGQRVRLDLDGTDVVLASDKVIVSRRGAAHPLQIGAVYGAVLWVFDATSLTGLPVVSVLPGVSSMALLALASDEVLRRVGTPATTRVLWGAFGCGVVHALSATSSVRTGFVTTTGRRPTHVQQSMLPWSAMFGVAAPDLDWPQRLSQLAAVTVVATALTVVGGGPRLRDHGRAWVFNAVAFGGALVFRRLADRVEVRRSASFGQDVRHHRVMAYEHAYTLTRQELLTAIDQAYALVSSLPEQDPGAVELTLAQLSAARAAVSEVQPRVAYVSETTIDIREVVHESLTAR